jgi:pantoate--beta-alanine ligase
VTQPHVPHLATVAELRRQVRNWRRAGETVGLVPTMGALHAGHIELVRQAKTRADRVVTSIFVNPAQFAPHEDFDRYPRTLDTDLKLLTPSGCDLVWAPAVREIYPDGFATRVTPAGAAEGLETDFRPHFFGGVATVCTKLFTQVAPDFAMFGEKDYQQLCVMKQLVRDLNLPLEIVGAATIREADGLAMSSRNRYLTAGERTQAPVLYRAITAVANDAGVKAGKPDAIAAAVAKAGAEILGADFGKIDYVAVREAETLAPVANGQTGAKRVLVAAWLGKTRLIDNIAA